MVVGADWDDEDVVDVGGAGRATFDADTEGESLRRRLARR